MHTHCGHGVVTHNPYCHGHGHHGGYHSFCYPPQQPVPVPTPQAWYGASQPVARQDESLVAAKVDKLTDLVEKLATKVEELEKSQSEK